MQTSKLIFSDNPAVKGREPKYCVVRVKAQAVVKNWKNSLYSFEWLEADGSIRTLDSLPLHERDKRLSVENALKAGKPVIRPVLGIGIFDTVEIGAGREVFLTLASAGLEDIEVHIPKSNEAEFKKFLI
jgi:hypothetical protein